TGVTEIALVFGNAIGVTNVNINMNKKEASIEKLYERGELLTRDEIVKIIEDYEAEDEGSSLGSFDIADRLSEDYNKMVGHMFFSSFMIDESFSDEDNKQIMAWADMNKRDFMGTSPVKRIVNPIEGKTNKQAENRLLKVSELYLLERDAINFFRDTEGFYDIDGLAIGYPFLTKGCLQDGELTAYLSFKILVEDNVQLKDLDSFFEKYENIEMNGTKMTEDSGVYRQRDDESFWKESFDEEDDYVFFENTMVDVKLRLPLQSFFEQELPSFPGEDNTYELADDDREKYDQAMDEIFDIDQGQKMGENPVIHINGIDIELSDQMIINSEDQYEGDVTIVPEVKHTE